MNTYTTHSGQVLDFDFIKPENVSIEDIAHSLSFQCRFNGHTKRFYSVAEHSLVLRDLVQEESGIQNLNRRIAAMLHDAAECYLGDITKPAKERLFIGEAVEGQILRVIFEAFGIPFSSFDEELKAMDSDLCIMEGFFLIGGMYWSKAYYDLVKRNPIFVSRVRNILAQHDGEMWKDPSHVASFFGRALEEEWFVNLRTSLQLEAPNVEPAE